MLLSIILSLTPTVPTRLEGFYGREAQAWMLGQVRRHAPGVAQALHPENGAKPNDDELNTLHDQTITHLLLAKNGLKPYTVSSLIVPEAGRRESNGETWLMPRDECLLRITSLAGPLSEILTEKVIPNLPRRIILRGREFRVLGPSAENHWWGETSFKELIKQADQVGGGQSVTLEFASPTAFRSGQVDMTLPTPEQVWRSLWWRWNNFAPDELQIDPLWTEFAANCIVVSDFQLRSLKVTFKGGEKGAATGCTGQATYRLLPEKHCGQLAAYREGADSVLRTLAGFALYAGVGHHTTIGMGQTRWLQNG